MAEHSRCHLLAVVVILRVPDKIDTYVTYTVPSVPGALNLKLISHMNSVV